MVKAAWAKFDQATGESGRLVDHLADTAEVARLLLPKWLSRSQRDLLAKVCGGEEMVHKLAVWLGAAHDVGKATVTFAIKAKPAMREMEDAGFVFPTNLPTPDAQKKYPHGLAGLCAVREYLSEKSSTRATVKSRNAVSEIVGGHHGVFSTALDLQDIPVSVSMNEDPGWGAVRVELLRRADVRANLDDAEWIELLQRRIPESAQAIFTGFLIVCDWIASNRDYFPYDDHRASDERAADALDSLNFGDHWRTNPVDNIDIYFSERFGITGPRPVQRTAVETAQQLTEPSFMLIETQTGDGKTEAGFCSAEALAEKFGLHGAMIVLPTRATSNAMFRRTLSWLESGTNDGRPVSITLAHAKAQFDRQFRSLFGKRGKNGGASSLSENIYDEEWKKFALETAVVVNQWTTGRKKNILADFVIGTIDQLLFMTLKSRHLVLRHLSFSGKVIIIDEIHAADEFMRTYLKRTLQWLGSYNVPVIALSATLPPAQRAELLHAYRQGALKKLRIDEGEGIHPEIYELAHAEGYPLITAIGATTHHQVTPEQSRRKLEYKLEHVSDENLVDRLLAEAEAGGCIAVVCNTVNRAQKVFEDVRAKFDGDVELFHSRFTVESRNAREDRLVRRLGPGADDRPERMIVVATQVIESSLDVDFDLMFTDIAPVDLLIQRMGRVHRHTRAEVDRPESMRTARVILSGGDDLLPSIGAEPASLPAFDRGVSRVYGDALLLRTVAALYRNSGRIGAHRLRIPDDVPELIRDVYREEPDVIVGWEERTAEAEVQRADLIFDQQLRSNAYVLASPGAGRIEQWNRLGLAEASEEQMGAAQVRDAELSIEVVLVQRYGSVCYPVKWLPEQFSGRQIDSVVGIDDSELERIVATCVVALPSWMTQGNSLDSVLNELERNGFEGWQKSVWLRGMLPLVLDEDLSATLNGHRVRYDEEVGLIIEQKEK